MKRFLILLLLVSCLSCSQKQRYTNLIYSYSRVYKVDPVIIYSMVEVESGFDNSVIGTSGEIGVGQIIYKWHRKRCNLKSEEDLKNVRKNIKCVCVIYKDYSQRTRNPYQTVAMYNAGPKGFSEGLGREHATKVNKVYKKYRGVNLWQTT